MMAQPHIKCLNSGTKPRHPDLESELADWVRAQRNELKPVSRSMVQIKVTTLAKSQKYISQYPNIGQFRWSSKWLSGFLRRYNFSNRRRTTVVQHLPADLEAQRHEFLNFVQYHHLQHNYSLQLMGNMDETPLAFDMPNNVTINDIGSKTVGIRTCGYEKSCFTVVLACMADGSKLPPMIIFKLKNVPRLRFPPGVIVRANEKGWMNETEMMYWTDAIWNNRTPCAMNLRSLLVMDSFKGHLVPPVKNKLLKKNTNIAIIPGGLTSKLQPLDVSINKSFKAKIRSMYNEWISHEIKELTPAGRIKRPPYDVIAEWVQRSWDAIDPQLIKCSFKCCGISVSSDGSEENLIFNYDQVENYEVEDDN